MHLEFFLQYLSLTNNRLSITSFPDLLQNWQVRNAVSLNRLQHSLLASARHSLNCILQNMLRNWLSTWKRAVQKHIWSTQAGAEQANVSLSVILVALSMQSLTEALTRLLQQSFLSSTLLFR